MLTDLQARALASLTTAPSRDGWVWYVHVDAPVYRKSGVMSGLLHRRLVERDGGGGFGEEDWRITPDGRVALAMHGEVAR